MAYDPSTNPERHLYPSCKFCVWRIADLPDATGGLAFSLAVDAFGAVRLSTIPLITPEEIDAATKKVIAYRPPGA